MKKLLEKRAQKKAELDALLNKAKTEERAFSEEERAQFDALEAEIKSLDAIIKAEERAKGITELKVPEAASKGGEAGTALNAIMTRLATDTKSCATELAEYGVNEYDAERNMQSLSSILEGVSGHWETLTDQEQASLAKMQAGTNHYAALQTIMSGLSDSAEEAGMSFGDYTKALAGLYMSAYPLTNYTTDYVKTRYVIWVANYGVAKPSYSGAYSMWQSADNGSIAGIGGNVDLDQCYTDYPEAIKSAGLNGFPKPELRPDPEKKTMKVTVEYDDHKYSGLLEEI